MLTKRAGFSEAEVPATGVSIVFLYIGAAGATVRPYFVRALRGHAVAKYSNHRTIESPVSLSAVKESIRACDEEGFGHLIIVGDLGVDGYAGSVGLAFSATTGLLGQGRLNSVKAIEFFCEVDGEDGARELVEKIAAIAALSNARSVAPCVKAFALINSVFHRRSELPSVLSALANADPSRMASIGEGIDGLRRSADSGLFLILYQESPVPPIMKTARLAVDNAILKGTFESLGNRQTDATNLARVEALLNAHQVGVDEPNVAMSFKFLYRSAQYRDALLHPLMTLIVKTFPDDVSFAKALDNLTDQMMTRSPPLSAILADIHNALVAAQARLSDEQRRLRTGALGVQVDQGAEKQVRDLLLNYHFALWPILDAEARPPRTAVGLAGLYDAYEGCVSKVAALIRNLLASDLRAEQDAQNRMLVELTSRFCTGCRLPLKSYLFVPSDLQTDSTDELWPFEDRSALLSVVKVEHSV